MTLSVGPKHYEEAVSGGERLTSNQSRDRPMLLIFSSGPQKMTPYDKTTGAQTQKVYLRATEILYPPKPFQIIQAPALN